MNINIHIGINMNIDITLPTPHPMPGPSADGAGGGMGWGGCGDINIHIDINMNVDIHIIINMDIEDYTKVLFIRYVRYSLLGIPLWLFHIAHFVGCRLASPRLLACLLRSLRLLCFLGLLCFACCAPHAPGKHPYASILISMQPFTSNREYPIGNTQ